jgi:hypothetical protein
MSVFADTSGEALRRGLEAAPDFVKPNLQEASDFAGCQINDADSAAKVAQNSLMHAPKASRFHSVGMESFGKHQSIVILCFRNSRQFLTVHRLVPAMQH